jgi:hypothetical protein
MYSTISIDEGEKKAVEYLQKKFNPKSIKVTSSGYAGPGEISVKGSIEAQDGTLSDFKVDVSGIAGNINSWTLEERKSK